MQSRRILKLFQILNSYARPTDPTEELIVGRLLIGVTVAFSHKKAAPLQNVTGVARGMDKWVLTGGLRSTFFRIKPKDKKRGLQGEKY